MKASSGEVSPGKHVHCLPGAPLFLASHPSSCLGLLPVSAMSPWPTWGLDYFFIKFVIIEKCKSFATYQVKQAVEVKAFSLPAACWAPTLFWGKGNIVGENKHEAVILSGTL